MLLRESPRLGPRAYRAGVGVFAGFVLLAAHVLACRAVDWLWMSNRVGPDTHQSVHRVTFVAVVLAAAVACVLTVLAAAGPPRRR